MVILKQYQIIFAFANFRYSRVKVKHCHRCHFATKIHKFKKDAADHNATNPCRVTRQPKWDQVLRYNLF